MNYRSIIVAGAIAIGLYLFSKTKKISDIAAERKTAQSGLPAVSPTIRQRTAQKIAQKIAQKVAQKVAPKRIGQPTTQIARIVAARKAAARKAAARKAAIRKAAVRKAAIRKAAAQKIGKKIGERVAQKIPQILKTRRALALYAKRQRPQIQRPRLYKKKIASRLFSGAEKSRIIPYSESSRHSYYGPKSHKLFNEGYQSNKGYAKSIEAYHDAVEREVLSNPKLWNRWPERRKP